jgi:hypothetical protein
MPRWGLREATEGCLSDSSRSFRPTLQRGNADKTVDARIPETFSWLLVPTQGDPRTVVEWQALRLSGGDTLAIRASKKLRNDGLIALQYAPALLRSDLDRIPLWRGDHVSTKQLADDYAQYLYLQRVRDPEVLITSIRQGLESITWRSDTFAYAARFEAASERYFDLVGGKICTVLMDGNSLLVKPDVAAKQIELERANMQRKPQETGGVAGGVKLEREENPRAWRHLGSYAREKDSEVSRFGETRCQALGTRCGQDCRGDCPTPRAAVRRGRGAHARNPRRPFRRSGGQHCADGHRKLSDAQVYRSRV